MTDLPDYRTHVVYLLPGDADDEPVPCLQLSDRARGLALPVYRDHEWVNVLGLLLANSASQTVVQRCVHCGLRRIFGGGLQDGDQAEWDHTLRAYRQFDPRYH